MPVVVAVSRGISYKLGNAKNVMITANSVIILADATDAQKSMR